MLKNDKTSLSDHHNAIIVYSNHESTTSRAQLYEEYKIL